MTSEENYLYRCLDCNSEEMREEFDRKPCSQCGGTMKFDSVIEFHYGDPDDV